MTLEVFVDTTTLSKTPRLESSPWRAARSAARDGRARVAVSQVSLHEIDRQARTALTPLAKELETWTTSRLDVDKSLPSLLPAYGDLDLVPTPKTKHDDLVLRDLERRKPFGTDGKGYRDALIWHTFVSWVTDENIDEAYFVSANCRDFAVTCKDDDLELHPDLVSDLPAGVSVHLVRDMTALSLLIPAPSTPVPSLHEKVERWVDNAAINFALDVDLSDYELDVPIEGEGSVYQVLDSQIDTLDLIESLEDGVTLWQATVVVTVEVEGALPLLDALSEAHAGVHFSPLNDHYVEATFPLTFEVEVDVRVEADESSHDATVSTRGEQ